jgi:hypothetical protein
MASPWKKSVAVTLESVNPLKYSIQPTGSDPLPTSNGALVFDNDHHRGFDIDFTFTDATKSGYLWPPTNLMHQAVWSKVGTSDTCPASPDAQVFHATGVDKSCTVLSVNNPNPSPAQGAFQYTLCVTNDCGTSYLPLDPGGVNNNGPISRWNVYSVAIATAATIAVVTVVAYELGAFK